MLFIGLLLGLSIYVLFAIYRSAFRVEEGHVGLVTSHGAVLRGQDGKMLKIYRPGLHLRWPWQEVHHVALLEQIIELSGADGARTAMAEDGTVLRLESILRYLPLDNTLYDYVFDLRSPREIDEDRCAPGDRLSGRRRHASAMKGDLEKCLEVGVSVSRLRVSPG